MSVAMLSKTMSSSEFVEWMAFARLEPFGSMVDDVRAGTIAAATYNVQRSSETDPTVDPLDLFGWTEKPAKVEKPETPDEVIARLRRFTDGLGHG